MMETKRITYYDKNGKLIKEKEDYSYTIYEYDKGGNLIEKKVFSTLFAKVLGYISPTIYKSYYDSNNNQIRMEGEDWHHEYKYNEKNLRTELTSYENNKIKWKNKCWYNDKGDIIKVQSWNDEGLLKADENKYYLYEDNMIMTKLTI